MKSSYDHMSVLVYGGTGSQSRPVVRHLLARGHAPYVLTRQSSGARGIDVVGSHLVRGDLDDPDSLRAASRGMDAIAFMVPAFLSDRSKIPHYVRSALHAAREADVQLIVWNTSGSLPTERGMGDAADQLLDVWEAIESSNIPSIAISPTTYMENLLGPWTVNSVRERDMVAYPVLADRKMGWIAADDIGALIVAAIERPWLAGKVFRVSGIEATTGPELAAAFSEVLGRSIAYYAMTGQEMGRAVDQAYGPGSGALVAAEYGKEQKSANPPLKYHDMAPVLSQLPVKMTTIRRWISDHASQFASNRIL